MKADVILKDSVEAFKNAIDKGILKINPHSNFPVHEYMYMYSKDGFDFFKNYCTREYIKVEE